VRTAVVYLAIQAGILAFLAATAPAILGVALGLGLVIGWAFYAAAKWLMKGKMP
jgi:hypothetical protein